MTGDF